MHDRAHLVGDDGEFATRQPGLDLLRVAAIAATLHGIASRRVPPRVMDDRGPAWPGPDPLAPPGWRNVRFTDQRVTYTLGDTEIQIGYRPTNAGLDFASGGKTTPVSRFGRDGDRLWFVEHGGHRRQARVFAAGSRVYVLAEGVLLALVEQPQFPDHAAERVAGALPPPMPGKVGKILAEVGAEVADGSPLLVLEAMKMECTVRAAEAGTVRSIHVAVGDQVDADRLFAVVTA